MPHDNNKNDPSSGPTSGSAPKTPLSEADFLTKQANDARAAISSVMNDLKRDLASGVDPKGWVHAAPWTTLAGAAVAGFVAAAVAVPSKEEQTLKRLKKIEEALNPRRRPYVDDATANGDGVKQARGASGGFLSGLATQVLRAIQPVLMSAITAGVTAKTVQPDQEPQATDPGEVAYGSPGAAGSGDSPAI